ncbi:reverse transcriptase [Plakobranchus ocellatus]|uniref:Reverse transcriptase n=1 Tax=Plakobranchus ocellatus TaxID=259542 RepID=A0AAV3XZ56_9GAST|nr:reverse transcriptase [Plakobranchus ocellatus]
MDDTTIICSKTDKTRRILTRLDVLMSWCRMEPKKSHSLSIWKGKFDEATTFKEPRKMFNMIYAGSTPRQATQERKKVVSREASGSHDLDVARPP